MLDPLLFAKLIKVMIAYRLSSPELFLSFRLLFASSIFLIAQSSLSPPLLRSWSHLLPFVFQLSLGTNSVRETSSPVTRNLVLQSRPLGRRKSQTSTASCSGARLTATRRSFDTSESSGPWPMLNVRLRRTEHHSGSLVHDRAYRCQWSVHVRVQELHASLPAYSDKPQLRVSLHADGTSPCGRISLPIIRRGHALLAAPASTVISTTS